MVADAFRACGTPVDDARAGGRVRRLLGGPAVAVRRPGERSRVSAAAGDNSSGLHRRGV